MEINKDIFKAYDIRGIYPKEINEEAGYFIGRAYSKFLAKKKPKIAVGRDARISSPSLYKSLTKGLIDQGADVVDIGFSITPLLYFAVAHLKIDGGVNITASHNPPQYNGFKLVREKAIPISGDTGIEEIKKIALKGKFKEGRKGRILKREILKDYIRFNLKNFNLKKIKPLKIVTDTANGVAGISVAEFFKKTNHKVFHLYPKLDGTFPNHLPSPHEEKNLKGIKKEVSNRKADLGIAFDGDGDRIIFIDEKGKMVRGDYITALMIKLILKNNPGEKVLCDVRSSNIVRETAKEAGGKVVLGRVGHSFIKEKMRKENIIFQGELNGHYYLRSHYFCEAPFYVILRLIEEISNSGIPLSELVKPFQKYYYSGEINLAIKDKKTALLKLERKFKKGKINKIDGLRVDFPDWWFNARPSNTEPVLRLVVEAKTKKLLAGKTHLLSDILKG